MAERSKAPAKRGVAASIPVGDKYFHFEFFACFLFLTARRSPYKWYIDIWKYNMKKMSTVYIKPQSDIHCNRSATSPRLTIFTDRRGRNKVPDRSRRGCREVGDWSGTSLRPNQSQQGFCACTKTWLRLIWSQTGPGEVADQSPISRRLVADRSPTNFVRIGAWLSLKLVGDWSAIGRRLIGDLSATSLQLVGDLSATCSKIYSIS